MKSTNRFSLILGSLIASSCLFGTMSFAAASFSPNSPVLRWIGGTSARMNQLNAQSYCKKQGARLPSREEFEQLALQLTQATGEGYSPYAADHVTETIAGLSQGWLWTSTVGTQDSSGAYEFNGQEGLIGYTSRGKMNAVICVIDARTTGVEK